MSEPVDVAPVLAPVPPSLAVVGAAIETRVRRLLDVEIERWTLVDEGLRVPLVQLRTLVLAGGKRLRPAFFHWAFVGAGGDPDDPRVVDLGAALELLHTFALVHDDVMDNADTRRGGPSVHAEAMTTHTASGWRDLAATASGVRDPAVARRIEWYKSGKYTVERPLHLGAAVAGRAEELRGPFSAFGLPLGEAFQMRDDLLSVFGDPALTGKPVGDDLREGKLTPLVAATAARADADGRALLERIGTSDITDGEIAALQQLMVRCGAVREVETAIEALVAESLAALARAPITEDARTALAELGNYVAWRDR
jgi:geranylgeranyl diphosphate synthase type I